jgi:hypothetical protein
MRFRVSDLVLVAAIVIVGILQPFPESNASPATAPWYAPLESLSPAGRSFAECVMYRESRSTLSHPNLGDDNGVGENTTHGEDSGIFQMNNGSNGVWDLYAKPTLRVDLSRATAYQQAEGFVLVYRVDGVGPWRRFDGC